MILQTDVALSNGKTTERRKIFSSKIEKTCCRKLGTLHRTSGEKRNRLRFIQSVGF